MTTPCLVFSNKSGIIAQLNRARAFQVPKTLMTNLLAGLDRRGLIQMRPNPSDGRSKVVWLTDARKAFRKDAIARLTPNFDWVTANFPPDRIAAQTPALAEIRAWLDSARDTA